MAKHLRTESELSVETVKGGLGEFSIFIDDQRVIDTNRLWYPSPVKIVEGVRVLLVE